MDPLAGPIFSTLILVWIYINRLYKQMIALRLSNEPDWEWRDGLKWRRRKDGRIELLALDGYRTFKTDKAYEKFMVKRPDLRGVK